MSMTPKMKQLVLELARDGLSPYQIKVRVGGRLRDIESVMVSARLLDRLSPKEPTMELTAHQVAVVRSGLAVLLPAGRIAASLGLDPKEAYKHIKDVMLGQYGGDPVPQYPRFGDMAKTVPTALLREIFLFYRQGVLNKVKGLPSVVSLKARFRLSDDDARVLFRWYGDCLRHVAKEQKLDTQQVLPWEAELGLDRWVKARRWE